ncbi:MAG: efflux RND transporter periplasmic adaptor subunit [Vulcanimicrobiaceae bacterium]
MGFERWLARACFATAIPAICLLASCGSKPPPPAPSPPQVPTAKAQNGTVRPTMTLAGFVAPAQSVAITSTLAEPAVAVNVQEGDRVHQGEVLAVLRTSDLYAQLAYDLQNAAANNAVKSQNVYQGQLNITQGYDALNQARANLKSAEATLANAQRDLARYEQLYSQGYVSQQQYQTQQTTVENDSQAVRNAQAAVRSAAANVTTNGTLQNGLQAAKIAQAHAQAQANIAQADQTRVSIGSATIASPINGIVVNRNLNIGEYPGTRQIFTLQEEDYVYAILSASAARIFQIPVGAPVNVSVHGMPQKFAGKVAAVLDQLTPGSTNFAIKVRIPNPTGVLRSGVTVSSTIALRPVSGTTIPSSSFLDENHNTVMVVEPNDVTKITDVTESATNGSTSVVSGLAPGSTVVSNGQLGLADGQKVAVRGSP